MATLFTIYIRTPFISDSDINFTITLNLNSLKSILVLSCLSLHDVCWSINYGWRIPSETRPFRLHLQVRIKWRLSCISTPVKHDIRGYLKTSDIFSNRSENLLSAAREECHQPGWIILPYPTIRQSHSRSNGKLRYDEPNYTEFRSHSGLLSVYSIEPKTSKLKSLSHSNRAIY